MNTPSTDDTYHDFTIFTTVTIILKNITIFYKYPSEHFMDRGETGPFGDQNDKKWTISLRTKSCWYHGVDGPSRLNVVTLEKCVGGLKGMKVNAS